MADNSLEMKNGTNVQGIDLRKFCSADITRKELTAPFSVNGLTFATNGHLFVATEEIPGFDPAPNESLAKVLMGYLDDMEGQKFVSPGEIPYPEQRPCSVCLGRGKAGKEFCRECDGEGEVTLKSDYNEYEVTCKSCDGDGFTVTLWTESTCTNCGGDGQVFDRYASMPFMNGILSPSYLHKITSAFPDALFCCKKERGGHIYFFKTETVRGAILGMCG